MVGLKLWQKELEKEGLSFKLLILKGDEINLIFTFIFVNKNLV